ncbi:hypothetical protein [Streptomyces sp. VRA16 Mangrove soil]|uniref:hypothetical protein n=1 Tax=Streptomyces sp. VRA16 Mangrove soil TaxID=2817434 RepID=UPI001A9DA6D2|nr:hypothetical protein [Streptomyces sp. VRA16 Mangrove soil]MBO1331123.1 hypothetical protein [Streptomyces sp. VRA16 Mangrove soil]
MRRHPAASPHLLYRGHRATRHVLLSSGRLTGRARLTDALLHHLCAPYETARPAGLRVGRTEFNGGHDYACWRGALIDAPARMLSD